MSSRKIIGAHVLALVLGGAVGALLQSCDQRTPDEITTAKDRALYKVTALADGWDARAVLHVQVGVIDGTDVAYVIVDPDGNRWLALKCGDKATMALAPMPRATSTENR